MNTYLQKLLYVMQQKNAAIVVGGLRGNLWVQNWQIVVRQQLSGFALLLLLLEELVLNKRFQALSVLFEYRRADFVQAVEKDDAGPGWIGSD